MSQNLRKRFIPSAGGWKDMKNINKIKDEIYSDRKISKRKELLID